MRPTPHPSRWAPPILVVLGAAVPGQAVTSAPSPPAARALLVGIDDYAASGLPGLRGAKHDCERVRELLRRRFGWPDDAIVMLLDAQATHANVVHTFHRHLVADSGPDTKVLFFFAGHGSVVPDRSGRESDKWQQASPHDNCLLLADSRIAGRNGSYDFCDDELAALLAAVAARTPDVVAITDCCHAAGNTRGARAGDGRTTRREVEPGTAPLDLELIRAFWPLPTLPPDDDAPTRQAPLRYVHLAAAEEYEVAEEFDAPSGRSHGRFTWHLTHALDAMPAHTTWRQLGELVRARVGAEVPQGVRWAGNVDRLVFGGEQGTPPRDFAVERDGGRLRIDCGRVHGLGTVSEFTVLDHDGNELGRAATDTMHATCSIATWVGTDEPAANVPLRARPRTTRDGRPAATLWHGADIDPRWLADCPWVTVVGTRPTAELVLARDGDRFVLHDAQGHPLRTGSLDHDALHAELYRAHCWRSLWELASTPGRWRLAITLRAASEQDRRSDGPSALARVRPGPNGTGAVVTAPALTADPRSGGLALLTVQNLSDEALYVSVLSVSEAPEVTVLLDVDDQPGPVPPRGVLTIPVALGPVPGWQRSRRMVDRLVAIGTARPAHFDQFQHEAPVFRTRGGPPKGNPLPAPLALPAGTRGGPPEAQPWGAASFDVHLQPTK